MQLSTLLLALVMAFGVSASFGDINEPSVRTLNSDNFYSTTKTGAWLIEYFSPYCRHCKKFAPVWQDVTEYYDHLEETSDFHFARVNCITSGDLCKAQNVNGYPELFLYADSLKVDEYDGARDFDSLGAYVSDEAGAWKLYKESPPL